MPEDKGEMGMTFTALVRIHEANCKVEFPSEEQANFTLAIEKEIARRLGLAELKQKQIQGPAKGLQRPKNPTA
jgi:hypothetical protein